MELKNKKLSVTEILRRLLVPLWLRPESAMWYAHMLYMAREFLGTDIEKPSLEFGCMDGVNTVVLLGGEFNETFDVYREVSWSRDSHKQSTLKDDYFNTVNKSVELVDIKKPPTTRFDFGVDWKDAHLVKSERMSVFNKLIKINTKKPQTKLESKSIRTIWAPNIYWTEDMTATLAELHRILHPEGRIITIAPDKKQLEFMFYRFADKSTSSWLKNLDRGRYENASRHARILSEWEKVFGEGGLRITRHEQFIPAIVAKVYDIGFRPMFPVFMNMYEKLLTHSDEELLDLKKHWIETAFHFFSPLCDTGWMENMKMENGWHIFELKLKSKGFSCQE
ncbi:MAG: hypothetical protein OEV42_08555 [Deltaproteobacteria bacterium]|nr:hypothetical protein [Deltaproteobacteria bacterium]